jgi:hypothetical protein
MDRGAAIVVNGPGYRIIGCQKAWERKRKRNKEKKGMKKKQVTVN